MRIAVTYERGKVYQHFGYTQRFKIYDVQDGAVVTATTVNTNGSGHGALADILKKLEVDTLICGGIGEGARQALTQAGIRTYGGVTGDTDQAVETLLAGTLRDNPEVNCSRYGRHRGHPRGRGCGGLGLGLGRKTGEGVSRETEKET